MAGQHFFDEIAFFLSCIAYLQRMGLTEIDPKAHRLTRGVHLSYRYVFYCLERLSSNLWLTEVDGLDRATTPLLAAAMKRRISPAPGCACNEKNLVQLAG